jgi:hypothetical protein
MEELPPIHHPMMKLPPPNPTMMEDEEPPLHQPTPEEDLNNSEDEGMEKEEMILKG